MKGLKDVKKKTAWKGNGSSDESSHQQQRVSGYAVRPSPCPPRPAQHLGVTPIPPAQLHGAPYKVVRDGTRANGLAGLW
jgi:hypothetical protein